jgi:tetratricopeptide (TPR) repeat protein
VETIQTRCRILDNLAITHYHLDNLPLAELFSREAWELATKDDSLRCSLRGTRAAVLIDLKRYAEAERLLRDALDEAQEAGREAEEIRHRFNLGCCLSERGDTEEGLRHLRIASGQAAERGSPDLRATSLCFFGRSLYKAGRKDEALGPLLGALQIAQKHNFRNDAFLSAYYLWCLARENQEATAEAKYLEIARQHRIWLQQRSEEAGLFDVEVRRSGRRRRVSSAAGPR